MRSERSLRRLVVDVAGLHPDDAALVLDLLGREERQSVEVLLSEFLNGIPVAPVSPRVLEFDRTRLSPWLAARLENAQGMTPHAVHAMRTAASRLFPVPVGERKGAGWLPRFRAKGPKP